MSISRRRSISNSILNVVLIVVSLIALIDAQARDCSGFKEGAQQFVTVRYAQQIRRGKTKTDVTQAEITWKPQDMLSDLTCFNLAETALLYKTDKDSEYSTANVDQRSAGEAAKWTLDVKPCLQYQFALKVVGETESIFELPNTLGPADEESISLSSFTPEAPTGFTAKEGATMATLSWLPSDCAGSYYVTYREVGSNEPQKFVSTSGDKTTVEVTDLNPCTTYEVIISAYLNDEAETSGDLVVNFDTKPRLDAARDMKVDISTTMNSAVVTMEVWSVSCIKEFEMKVCNSEMKQCLPTALVTKTAGIPTISQPFNDLDPCTDYTLEILPLYPDTEIERRLVTFRTKSPEAGSVEVGQVVTEQAGSSSLKLNWPSVRCASTFRVYQREAGESDWIQVADTEEQEINIQDITPCTQYKFAVAAVLNEEETVKSEGNEVMIDLNEQDPFNAPNLNIANSDRHADLSWDHAECITSYVVKVCEEAYTPCREHEVEASGSKTIEFRLEDLEPCTKYSLEIIPVIPGRVFTAKVNDFTTTNGIPQPPGGFEVKPEDNTVKVSWESVQCATGYKIFMSSDIEGAQEESVVATDLEHEFPDRIRCTTYFFSVVSLVGEQESERTQPQSVFVEPELDTPPVLKILNNEKDNVTLRVDMPEENKRCEAALYELSFSSTGAKPYSTKTLKATAKGELALSFPGASSPHSIIQARIKYVGGPDLWSEIVSSREPGDRSPISQVKNDTSTLIPIIIGVILAAIIIILAIIFIVKRRKNRDNYDAEKADSNGRKNNGSGNANEETQKLNESPPEA